MLVLLCDIVAANLYLSLLLLPFHSCSKCVLDSVVWRVTCVSVCVLVGFSQYRFDCSWSLCASVGLRLTWGEFEPRCQSTSEQRVFRLRTDRTIVASRIHKIAERHYPLLVLACADFQSVR